MKAPVHEYSTHIYEMMARLGIAGRWEFCRNLVCGMRQRSADVRLADLRKLARTG